MTDELNECIYCDGTGTMPVASMTTETSEDGCAEVWVAGEVTCFSCDGTGKETP